MMSRLSSSQLRLSLQLTVIRLGWLNLLMGLLLVSVAAISLWWIPNLRAQYLLVQDEKNVAQKRLEQFHEEIAAPPQLSMNEQRLQDFYSNLGEKQYVEQQIKTLFSLANKNGLVLRHADYKLAEDKNGQFFTYTIGVPVRGTYAAIRDFCQQILIAIPFASLDQWSVRRDAISAPTIEAKLVITLYVREPHQNGAQVRHAIQDIDR